MQPAIIFSDEKPMSVGAIEYFLQNAASDAAFKSVMDGALDKATLCPSAPDPAHVATHTGTSAAAPATGPRVALPGQPIPAGSSANTVYTPQTDSRGEVVDIRTEKNPTWSRVASSCSHILGRIPFAVYRELTGRCDVNDVAYWQELIDDGEWSDLIGCHIYTVADAINHCIKQAERWASEDEAAKAIVGSLTHEKTESGVQEIEIGVAEALAMSDAVIAALPKKQKKAIYDQLRDRWKASVTESQRDAARWREQIKLDHERMSRFKWR